MYHSHWTTRYAHFLAVCRWSPSTGSVHLWLLKSEAVQFLHSCYVVHHDPSSTFLPSANMCSLTQPNPSPHHNKQDALGKNCSNILQAEAIVTASCKNSQSTFMTLHINKDAPHYRYTYITIPHSSPMFHSVVLIVCLLSAYLANSLLIDLDRRSGPPRPTNPREWFLI